VPKGKENSIKTEVVLKEDIKAPIQKGEVLGYIKYTLDGKEIGTNPLIASEDVYKNFLGNYYNEKEKNPIVHPLKIIFGIASFSVAFLLWKRQKIRQRKRFIFSNKY
jgi:D-alanyl-D-alanine carboxypeptidase (penicillin-binding protein 5/6)